MNFPGGKLEDGETPEDTARIETKEEAGVDVEIVQRIPSHLDHELKKVYHMYLAHLPEGAEIKISEEHDDIKWVSLEGAVALHHPNDVSEALNSLSHHARFGIEHLATRVMSPRAPLEHIRHLVCLCKPIREEEPLVYRYWLATNRTYFKHQSTLKWNLLLPFCIVITASSSF
jgi:8-oxo-dGTP pyrophosphatase MutT (NUDIX family)